MENESLSGTSPNPRLEYELIHKARMHWSDHMMRWRQIVLPLCAAIISFFILVQPHLWWIGWFLGLFILLYWRAIERLIDIQIRGFYLRILELEKELSMTFYSHYTFSNLNPRYPNANTIREYLDDGSFNYDELINLARQSAEMEQVYEREQEQEYSATRLGRRLLELVGLFPVRGQSFVTPRGHDIHTLLVAAYFVIGILTFIVYSLTPLLSG